MYTLYRYSIDFGMSFFLFIASTQFIWLVNGMRQFVAVCFDFCSTTFYDRKKMVAIYSCCFIGINNSWNGNNHDSILFYCAVETI